MENLFKGRKIIIATKHQKEKVIAPLFENGIKVKCIVPENFDTDLFGTFTGEIERSLDPISTIRKKCLSAMNLYNCEIGVASEGSFGPHPTLGFINVNEELIIFIDKKNKIEVLSRELSLKTNFDGQNVFSELELIEFAKRTKFPSHGLILKAKHIKGFEIFKDFKNLKELKMIFNNLIKKSYTISIETDMRAMNNPTRMKVIQLATKKIIEKLKTHCPNCNMIGFEIVESISGLPCQLCAMPTRSSLKHVYACKKCEFKKEKKYPNKKFTEDPMYCDFCNP